MSQKTIAIGTAGVPVNLDTNFGNAQDNFTELYQDKSTQDEAIALNTDKVGITTEQANAIIANTAKISFDDISSARLANTQGTNTGDQDLSGKQDLLTAASQAEMEAGTEAAIRSMSPLRVKQAIDALAEAGGATTINDLTDVDTTGKAAGRILVFDASGNLVVGDDQLGEAGSGITTLTAGTGLEGGGSTSTVTVSLSAANVTKLANTSGTNTGDQDLSVKENTGVAAGLMNTHESAHPAPTIRDARNQIAGSYAAALGADDNYVTDAEKIVIGNTSGVNTGDQDAAGVSFTPYGTIAATTVQAAIQELSDEKAEDANTAFVAGELADIAILTTAQPVTGEPLVSDTVVYGSVEDNLRVWSVEKVGSELAGKAPSLTADQNYVSDAQLTVIGNTSGTNSGDQDLSGLSTKIANGTAALGTAEIEDNTCASLITVSAPGVLTTDVVDIGYNSTPVGKTGYDPTSAELSIRAFPTADNINILVCNRTGAAVTPDAMTVNWRVVR